MRWVLAVGCVLLAACSSGGTEGSPTTSAPATTEPPAAEKGSIDGLEVSSAISAFFAHHGDTTYVVDAGRLGEAFEPTLRAFTDDGTVRTYAMPIEDPLVYVAPFWADGGLSVLGVECPGWQSGDEPAIDLNEPGEIRRVCGSADVVLRRWTPEGWADPKPVIEAPSGIGFRSSHGTQAILVLPHAGDEPGSDGDPLLVDLLSGEVDALPATPDGMQEVCLQFDGPVVVVDPESTDDGGSGSARPRWTAQRLEGDAWGAPVELPARYVAGCLGEGGFLVDARTSAIRVEVEPDGTLRTLDVGKPASANPQYQTILGTLAEGDGRYFVFSTGVWLDTGPVRDAFAFPVGVKVVLQPCPESGDGEDDGTLVLTPLTLQLQG